MWKSQSNYGEALIRVSDNTLDKKLAEILIKYKAFVEKYSWSTYTLGSVEQLEPALKTQKDQRVKSLVDLGCGYGVLTCIIAEYLGAEEVYGIDVDDERLNSEKPCKMNTVKHNLNGPIAIGKEFDLAVSFGVVKHMENWDSFIANAYTLLKEGVCYPYQPQIWVAG